MTSCLINLYFYKDDRIFNITINKSKTALVLSTIFLQQNDAQDLRVIEGLSQSKIGQPEPDLWIFKVLRQNFDAHSLLFSFCYKYKLILD